MFRLTALTIQTGGKKKTTGANQSSRHLEKVNKEGTVAVQQKKK